MWTALGVIVSALLGGTIQWLRGRRVDTATATDVISQAAQRLVADLSEDNKALRAEVVALRTEVIALRAEVHRLNTGENPITKP